MGEFNKLRFVVFNKMKLYFNFLYKISFYYNSYILLLSLFSFYFICLVFNFEAQLVILFFFIKIFSLLHGFFGLITIIEDYVFNKLIAQVYKFVLYLILLKFLIYLII